MYLSDHDPDLDPEPDPTSDHDPSPDLNYNPGTNTDPDPDPDPDPESDVIPGLTRPKAYPSSKLNAFRTCTAYMKTFRSKRNEVLNTLRNQHVKGFYNTMKVPEISLFS